MNLFRAGKAQPPTQPRSCSDALSLVSLNVFTCILYYSINAMSSSPTADVPPVDKLTDVERAVDAAPESQKSASVAEPDAKSPSSDGGLDSKLANMTLSPENASAADASKDDDQNAETEAAAVPEKENENSDGAQKEPKKTPAKPYVNPQRFLTGGSPREKLSPGELEKKIARIRENNEKIKQRQLTIQADEDAFKATQSADIKKQAQNRKIQDGINRNREQNAQRKMERMNNREWDSNKKRPVQGQMQKDKMTTQGQQNAPQVKATEGTSATPIL